MSGPAQDSLTPNSHPRSGLSLSSEEENRLRSAPFAADPNHWAYFAAAISGYVLSGYETGELDMRGLLKTIWGCSIGCDEIARMNVLGLTAARALKLKPKKLNARRPAYPIWLKLSAVNLVSMLKEKSPEASASLDVNRESPLLTLAIKWMVALGLTREDKPLSPKTLYGWCISEKKLSGQPVRRGRPAKKRPA